MINKKRAIDEFLNLISFDSISFHEGKIYNYLKNKLESLGLYVKTDDASKKISDSTDGGNNIYALLKGNIKAPSILFSSHMDTVSPGIGKEAIIDGDIIKSKGESVLGADDVTGIVAILEALTVIKEDNIPHPDIEVVFFVAEEPYCRGSSVFDFSIIKSKIAYVLDLAGDIGTAAIAAPSIFSITINIKGKSAHAGFEIERGISSVIVASNAISKLRLGRIDSDTTINIGTISGGSGKNIVPEETIITGEMRSYNREFAISLLKEIEETFRSEAALVNASIDFKYSEDIVAYHISSNSDVVRRYENALSELGYGKAKLVSTFGGSDNNNFNKNKIEGIVITNAMNDIHTKGEYFKISEFEKSINIVLKLMTGGDEK